MLKLKAGGKTGKGKSATPAKAHALAQRCAAIPGAMYGHKNTAHARIELESLATSPDAGILSADGKKGHALASLWFVRAVHEFARAAALANQLDHLHFVHDILLPMCKKIVHEFISENGLGDVRMDDGAMLVDTKAKNDDGALRLNALWYAALESTGQALRGIGPLAALKNANGRDHTGDHFERLAGRFRRSFAKAFWCDDHSRICPRDLRETPDHGTFPDVEQLLLTILPNSPLPRTKQRELMTRIESATGGTVGLKLQHRELGLVESPMHRAWLAQGAWGESDAEKRLALAYLQPLLPLRDAARAGHVHTYYRDGQPVGMADPLASAEVWGTLERFLPTTNM